MVKKEDEGETQITMSEAPNKRIDVCIYIVINSANCTQLGLISCRNMIVYPIQSAKDNSEAPLARYI